MHRSLLDRSLRASLGCWCSYLASACERCVHHATLMPRLHRCSAQVGCHSRGSLRVPRARDRSPTDSYAARCFAASVWLRQPVADCVRPSLLLAARWTRCCCLAALHPHPASASSVAARPLSRCGSLPLPGCCRYAQPLRRESPRSDSSSHRSRSARASSLVTVARRS